MITTSIEERHLVEEIIKRNSICFVGMTDLQGMPYVLPMNFGYTDNCIYLHSSREGHSVDILKKNPQVCITFCSNTEMTFQNEEVACSYRMRANSVICRGEVVFVQNYDEKVKALNVLMKQYTDWTFTYSVPAVNNVMVWKVEIREMSAKAFGMPHPNSHNYKDGNIF